MNKLDLILTDELVFPNNDYQKPDSYQERVTVKAIVENIEGKIAFVTNSVHGFYILPGGGAESDDLINEVIRECDEEINWEVGDIKDIASIEEFRNRDSKHYLTYCFSAKTIKELPEDTRTDDEKENGLEVVWIEKEEASKKLLSQVESLNKGEVEFYNTGFNILRDYMFFEEYVGKSISS